MSVDSYVDALVTRSSAILGDQLTGFYLAGSLGLGDFDPRRSDIDIALVVNSPLADDTSEELAQSLCHSAIECPVRGLELVTYTAAAAATGTTAPAFEMELNDGPQMTYRFTANPADRPSEDGTFWYAIDRDILHQAGHPMFGPDASDVFSAIPDDSLRTLLLESMEWWRGRQIGSPSSDAVLGACRSWIRMHTGSWKSKSGAGHEIIQLKPEWAAATRGALHAQNSGGGTVLGAEPLLDQIRSDL